MRKAANKNNNGTEELYDLRHAPEERANLKNLEVNVAEDLKQRIFKHLEMGEKVAAVIKEKRREELKEELKRYL